MNNLAEMKIAHTGEAAAPSTAIPSTDLEKEIAGADPWGRFANRFYPALVRSLTGLAIVALCAWMASGVAVLLVTLAQAFSGNWAGTAEHAIIDSLILLALLEVIRTLQSYLRLGRVRVTFILDTALVVLIGELMGLWFREYAPAKVALGLGVIVALVVLRIATTRFSPEITTEPRS